MNSKKLHKVTSLGLKRAFFIIAILLPISIPAFGQQQVTTYVTTVQTERQSTRFTLTEWLRIKERMKLMDVWLAMFSDPKKDKFSPEFYLSYSQLQGVAIPGAATEGFQIQGTKIDSQLWLTNLISSTTRLRTVNIDFGFGMRMESSSLTGSISEDTIASQTAQPTNDPTSLSSFVRNEDDAFARRQTTQLNLRLFGDNIQDSSLVFTYGNYDASYYQREVPEGVGLASGANVSALEDKGVKTGINLQLYVLNFLGMEGNYDLYKGNVASKNLSSNHTYYDYGAFLEISLLRIGGSLYFEKRAYETEQNEKHEVNETGLMTSVKLQF